MTTQELLSHCSQLGIRIWMEGERLRVYAPNGILTPEVRLQLAARQKEILRLLTGAERPPAGPATAAPAAVPALVRAPRGAGAPLSFAQQRLWLIDQLEPGSSSYNLPMALGLHGTLALPVLAAALGEIVRRHEVLRTTFPAVDGEPRQAVAPPGPVALPVVDLSGLSAPQPETERLLAAEARRPFDLARGPLLRFLLLRLGPEDHVAALNMHHIIGDGWSFAVLVREIAALYPAFLEGRPSPLPELPVQYSDFSSWQRERLRGPALDAEMAFWRERLRGAPPVLEMPTDRPRKAPQGEAGARRDLQLPPALTDAVGALARRAGATQFMTLLAAFQALLGRWTGQDDLSVGAPVAGRNRIETEGLIGFFINTLVLRTDLAGDPPFQELLGRVRTVTLDAFRHQDLPFEKLVEELQPERSLGHTPLFQVMLALLNLPREELGLTGLRLRPLDMDPGAAKLDLLLSLGETATGVHGALGYRTELFDASTMERLAGGFLRLLEGAVNQPAARLSELPWLSSAEIHQVLWEWNDTEAGLPSEVCLHRLVEDQVARTPEAVAVEMEGTALTYAELNARAGQLAAHLRGLGVRPESLVGICAERSPEMVVGLLGILKAGGAYVPLDPDLPPERLGFVLRDSGAPVLLAQSGLADRLPPHEIPTVLLDRRFEAPPGPPSVQPPPDSLAYVIYTSGSTGRPKGAMNTHRAVVNRLLWMQSSLGLTAADAVLQKTPFGFDVSVWELFLPLLTGARLVMAPPGAHRDPDALAATIERGRITVLHFVPSMLGAFLETRAPERCRGVRRVIASGEALPPELAAAFFARMPWAELHNLYGPTEAAIDVTAWACAPGADRRSVPIGRPIANLRITLLDAALQPVPIGAAGELYISGVGLARGYVGRPDLTAERFLPDPHTGWAPRQTAEEPLARDPHPPSPSPTRTHTRPEEGAPPPEILESQREGVPPLPGRGVRGGGRGGQGVRVPAQPAPAFASPGARIYRTGDLARFRADGAIEFLGRVDHQVKIRGFRIELGEIETALGAHPGVREAVVLARTDTPGDPRLVAYVVPREGAAPSPEDLAQSLAATLPAYMVPAQFVLLPALPLNPNGKVDRRALPTPTASLQAGETAFIAPRTPAEELLCAIWADVLGVPRVGVHDSFFALGGHSLFAARAVSRIRDAFGVEIPLRSLFEAPTAAGMSRMIEQTSGRSPWPPIARVTGPGPWPLSFPQLRFWARRHDLGAANIPFGVRFSGAVDPAALERSLREILRRHAGLRAAFLEIDGEPAQMVRDFRDDLLALPIVDLAALPVSAREEEVRRLGARLAAYPFDIEREILFKAALVRLADREHALFLVLHHIVTDGWSEGVLTGELVTLYQAFVRGAPSPLPELPVQVPDFAVWQRETLRGPAFDALLGHWRERLRGVRALAIPTDRPHPATRSVRGGWCHRRLDAALGQGIRALRQREGASFFMTVLAAWQALLSRWTGQQDVALTTNVANRSRTEIEGLIGVFTNVLALRTDLSGDPPFRELLRRVRATTLDAFAHQDLPFTEILRDLGQGHNELFPVGFLVQNFPPGRVELPDLALQPIALDSGSAPRDLILYAGEAGDEIQLSLLYREDIFDAPTLDGLLAWLEEILRAVVQSPDPPLSRLPGAVR